MCAECREGFYRSGPHECERCDPAAEAAGMVCAGDPCGAYFPSNVTREYSTSLLYKGI